MAIGTKSDVANQFLTGIAARTIVNVQRNLFLANLLTNQVAITGTDINNGVEKVKINILPTYTAKERTEGNNIDAAEFNPTTTIEVAINHRPYVRIGVTAQADENSIFGSRGDQAIDGLLAQHSVPAGEALRVNLEQNIAKDIALDTDILAGNKYTSAATAGVLNFSKAFFADLNKRYFEDEAPVAGSQKWLFVTPDDFEALSIASGLFDDNLENEKAVIMEPGVQLYLPKYGWYVRATNYLHTDAVTLKKVRVATTTNSTVIAPSEMRGIYGKTVARTSDGPLRFRLDLDGNIVNETNEMVLSSNYGIKVYQPKNVYLIQDA